MPAIQPELLKRQTEQIVVRFSEPSSFVRALHDHLEWYSDRTRRSGLNSPPPPILHTYRVPRQVIRELERQLLPYAEAEPPASLDLADALWEEENMECRQLAIDLLSWAPVDPVGPVEDRFIRWADPLEEPDVLSRLLSVGLIRYRHEAQDRYLRLSKNWLTTTDPAVQSLGIALLTSLANDDDFTNLPIIYPRAKSVIVRAPPDLQPDLAVLMSTLARRSPVETAHYLEECLKVAQGPGTASIIRRSLKSFPPEPQAQLRAALVHEF